MIDFKKLAETAEYHIKRGDSMQMDPKVVRELMPDLVELLDTFPPAAQINQQLVRALEKIIALEDTESNEWDAVDRLIPEMRAIAKAALAATQMRGDA